jgi:hypothetical protein
MNRLQQRGEVTPLTHDLSLPLFVTKLDLPAFDGFMLSFQIASLFSV